MGGDAEAFEFRSRVLEASGQIRPRAAGMGPERPSAIAGGQRGIVSRAADAKRSVAGLS